jgi:AcrR family transcriptional regulator
VAGVKGQVQQRGVRRRREIVHVAMDLIARHGYRGTSLAMVAGRAGVPTSLITHHFGTKEGLLRAVLEERDLLALAKLDDLDTPGYHAAVARLIQHAERQIELPESVALQVTLTVENLAGGAPLHDYFLRRNRLLRELLHRAVREGIDAGELPGTVDPDLVAMQAAAFLEGAALQWLLDPDTVDLVAAYRGYFDTLTAGLTAGGPITSPAVGAPGADTAADLTRSARGGLDASPGCDLPGPAPGDLP